MAIQNDISVAANGNIRWTGTTGTYSVLELHRFLQDLADNASATGDDLLDITDTVPSVRSTDNIITLNSPYNIDDTLAEHLYNGSITQDGGNTLYAGLRVVGSLYDGATQLMIVQNNTLLTNYWGTGLNVDAANNVLLQLCVKVRTGGSDIDGKRIRVLSREWGSSFAEFEVTMTTGVNVAAISTVQDLNNSTAVGTVSGWADISNVEGFQLIDLGNGSGSREYYSQWDRGSRTINQLYEYTKYLTRRGSASTVYGLNGQLFRGITHSWAYDGESGGPFTQNEILSWGTGATAGTARLLAVDDDGTTGNMYVQLITGVAPSNDLTITGQSSSATAAVNGSVTSRTISPTFLGSSTGTALIGAYGVGVQSADLTNADKLTDLSGTLQQPPNNVVFTVAGCVSGEDRILVGPDDGSGEIDYNQLTAAAGNVSGGMTLTVNESIPSDTPASGTVRVFIGSAYARVAYSSYTGSIFTLSSGLPGAPSTNADVFISYIDKLADATSVSFTTIYSTNRSLVVKVRDGGITPIVPFQTTATLSSAGGSVTAIRQSDV